MDKCFKGLMVVILVIKTVFIWIQMFHQRMGNFSTWIFSIVWKESTMLRFELVTCKLRCLCGFPLKNITLLYSHPVVTNAKWPPNGKQWIKLDLKYSHMMKLNYIMNWVKSTSKNSRAWDFIKMYSPGSLKKEISEHNRKLVTWIQGCLFWLSIMLKLHSNLTIVVTLA